MTREDGALYRPFIDDPAHIAQLDGQRYVVLRATGAVRDAYVQLQRAVKERLAGFEVSYPAQPHVTLAGMARGTTLDAVRDIVIDWAPSVPVLHLDIEAVTFFPTPFQIVIVQVRKTPALADAMSSLRERARQRGLTDIAKIAPADWVFHLSLAYCSSLTAAAWAETTAWVDALVPPTAQCVVSEAEIVAFGAGQESSGGAVALTGAALGADGQSV